MTSSPKPPNKVFGFTLPLDILPKLPPECTILMGLIFDFVNKLKSRQPEFANMSDTDQQQLFDQMWKDTTDVFCRDAKIALKMNVDGVTDQTTIQAGDVRLNHPDGTIII